MELTPDEKRAILNQRVKQFAAEKFNHEINKTLLSEQKKTAKESDKAEIDAKLAKTDEAIAEIDEAIKTTQSIEASLPVEAPVEAGIVE